MSQPDQSLPARIDRRVAIKWMLTAVASAKLLARPAGAAPVVAAATGYGTDPDLLRTYQPGELWPLTLTPAQRSTAAQLCDTIIPADSYSPKASQLGVHDFIDEWISAPYPAHDRDRTLILSGLAWIESEAQSRFNRGFAAITDAQRTALCTDICHVDTARTEFRAAARFFKRYRDLTAGGFYTTPEGMKDIGYVGNVPTVTFDGPTPEVLKQLGLA